MTYKMNLEQIRDAVLQSLYIGVIESLLRCKTNAQFFTQCYGRSLTALSARRRIEMECETFAEIQKSDHGWEMLNSRAQRNLKLNGVTPDAWVVDDGVKKYIASRRESWAYFLHGAAGEKLRLENQGVGDPKSLDIASNTLIFETKQFNLPNMDDPVNITSRKRAIGEYVVSFPHLDYASCGKYTSSMRDIMIYDEDRDGFTKLSLADGLKHCQRFNGGDGELSSHGFYPGPDRDGDDMFFTDKHPHGVEYFAQMREEDMPDQAIRDWITSVVGQFDAQTAAQLTADLETLSGLVEKLEATPDESENTKRFFAYVKTAYMEGHDPASIYIDKNNGMPLLDKIFGMTSLDGVGELAEDTGVGAKVDASLIPYGFASYAGICEIAKYTTSQIAIADEAKRAKKAIDTITQKINSVCYGNLFTQQFSVPFYFRDKCTQAAVFSNLVSERLPPVVIEAGKFDLKMGSALHYKSFPRREVLFNTVKKDMNISRFNDNPTEEESRQSDKLAEKVAHSLMGILENLSLDYRLAFARLLNKCTRLEVMEELYKVFMSEMDGHDWYSVSKAIDDANDDVNMLAQSLRATKGKKATDSTSEHTVKKDVVTPLTCSMNLDKYFQDKGLMMFSYGHMVSPQNEYMPSIGAGEVGDEVGIERGAAGSGSSRGAFGLKRKEVGGAPGSTVFESYRAWWEDDAELAKRVGDVRANYGSTLERVFGVAFLGNAVNEKTLKRFIATGCVFPFNVIYARPFQTYSVSTGICMKAGASTGETLVGHADFQLGDNVIQKLHYGNFTFYSKSVIMRQQQVYLALNMFSTAYNGGGGSDFFETKSDYGRYLENGNYDVRQKSIFAMLAPYSAKPMANPVDITGRYSGNLHPLNDGENMHYASANFYKKFWGWSASVEDAPGRCVFDNDDDNTPNTICFQGHQSLYNPSSGGMFDIVIKNTGHWGGNVYPGVGKVRNGHQKVVESVTYNNLYGGGGNLSGMLK